MCHFDSKSTEYQQQKKLCKLKSLLQNFYYIHKERERYFL